LGFSQKVIAELAASTGLPITEALDHFEAQAPATVSSRRAARCASSPSR